MDVIAQKAEVTAETPPKVKKVWGTVYLKPHRCKGCGFCIAFCPPQVLAFSEDFNEHGYYLPRLIDPDGCTGCNLCGMYCPDFAIHAAMLKYDPRPVRQAGQPNRGVES